MEASMGRPRSFRILIVALAVALGMFVAPRPGVGLLRRVGMPTAPPPTRVECYAPVVDAAVTDPFRAPAQRWLSGNRGLTFSPSIGQPVHAAAAGEVTFAGPVARRLHVTVLHANGLRTSYSYLDDHVVVKGQRVRRGQLLGHTGAEFHLGLRDGDVYLDPALLFATPCLGSRAVLVPLDGGPSAGSGTTRSN